MTPPTFSIITVVYNGSKLLPGTIDSVQQQSYPNIEYIIIDGNSKDGTQEIIQKYAAQMPYLRWISEKDKGLYDAMNKGLKMATGDFVWFLNCGDHLHSKETVALLAQQVGANTDVLYGETQLVNEDREPAGTMSDLSTRSVPDRMDWKSYLRGMLVVHQSFVARRRLAPNYIEHNLCADFDWCIKILKKSRETKNTGLVLADYLMGGMSKQRHRQSLIDRFEVMQQHYGLFPTLLAHIKIVFRALAHQIRRWGQKKY